MDFKDIRRCAHLGQVCKKSDWGDKVFFALEDCQSLPRIPFKLSPEVETVIRDYAPRNKELILVSKAESGMISMVMGWKPKLEEENDIDWMMVWP